MARRMRTRRTSGYCKMPCNGPPGASLWAGLSSCMATIVILGTLDTKGAEHAFVAEQIRARGHKTLIIDVGTLGEPSLKPDITRAEVAQAAGIDLAALAAKKDRGESVAAMTRSAPVLLSQLATAGRIDGVISLGGGGGTAIGTAAM